MPARRHTLVIGLVAAIAASVSHAQGATVEAQLIEQGQYWQARSNAVRAAEIWQKVLLIDPDQVQALYGMGLIGVKQNKPQQAQTYLTRLQALSPVPWQAVQLEQDIALGQPQNQALLDDARRLADAGERDKRPGCFANCSMAVCRKALSAASTTPTWASTTGTGPRRARALNA